MSDERRIDHMTGCSRLGKILLGGIALVVLVLIGIYVIPSSCHMTDCGPVVDSLRARNVMKDLRISIEAFHLEYGKYPIDFPETDENDTAIRTKSQIVEELSLFETAKINFKKIKFIDLPMARNRKAGLWQDGTEWVLSDPWGEPYHIVLDTNEDNVISNPDPDAAKSLPQIPSRVLIYSSGPDRDPKTWNDNICSWRVR